MALIEVELVRERFNQLVRSMASAGPIPIGLLNSLGPNRLIAEFTWDDAFVGQAPAGVAPPFGTLAARCPVSLRHVSLAELDADPLAPGTTTAATAWIRLVPSATDLALDLLAIDVPGAATQWFTPPVPVRRQRVRMAGVANLAGAALLMRDDVVTLRFATRPTDSLQGTPLNLLPTTGNEWAIRLSGEFFTERLLQSLQGALATPPAGTSIEEAPSAAWGMRDGAWTCRSRSTWS
jgi:hypothetical protein